MRAFTILFVLMTYGWGTLIAQHFEWATSLANFDASYDYSAIDENGNIIVGGESSISETDLHKNWPPMIFDKEGNKTELNRLEPNESQLLISYDKNGGLRWKRILDEKYVKLKGLAAGSKNEIYVLVKVEPNIRQEGKNYGVLSIDEERMEVVGGSHPYDDRVGHYIVRLNKKGEYLASRHLFEDDFSEKPELQFADFHYQKEKGFIIAGHYSVRGHTVNDHKLYNTKLASKKGNFLLKYDQEMKPNWVEIIPFEGVRKARGSTHQINAEFGPNDAIYKTGYYFKEANFGEGTKKKGKEAGYLASYSINGSLNWVKSSGSYTDINALHVSQSKVYVNGRLKVGNTFFEEKIDTAQGNSVLTAFSPNGSLKTKKINKVDLVQDIVEDQENHIYLLATFGKLMKDYEENGKIGDQTLENQGLTMAKYFPDLSFQWARSVNFPIRGNPPFHLHIDQCNNLFVSGTLYFSMKVPLLTFDNAFIKGEGSGSQPFVARFNNTIPQALAEAESKKDETKSKKEPKEKIEDKMGQQSCQISPGPWELSNHPNPFTKETRFTYRTTYADKVSLTLINMKGQKVKTFFTNVSHKKGKHEHKANLNLEPGIYVAMLEGSETTISHKIIIKG